MVGQREWIKDHQLHTKSHSVTILTSIAAGERPIVFTIREESNTALDFFYFILYCIAKQHLKNGDILILDNASVHSGEETEEELRSILEAAGIHLVYLPKYSPELNPCELVFNKVKNHLRNNRCYTVPLWYELIVALSQVNSEMMKSFYAHCLAWKNIRKKSTYLR